MKQRKQRMITGLQERIRELEKQEKKILDQVKQGKYKNAVDETLAHIKLKLIEHQGLKESISNE